MLRNCDVCNKEYSVCPSDLKRGFNYCCSKSCSGIKRKKENLTSYWEEVKKKFEGKIKLPDQPPTTILDKITMHCDRHGEVHSTLRKLYSRTIPCYKCAQNHVAINGSKKQCTLCNEWKELTDFRHSVKGFEAYCKQCKRNKDKEYTKTDSYKAKNKIAGEKFRAKKYLEKLDSGNGSSCNVYFLKCEICGTCKSSKKKIATRFCSAKCGIKYRASIRKGIKLPLRVSKHQYCKKCNNLFLGKQPGCCERCTKESIKISQNAQKKKRKAALRTVAIEAIKDMKVFERDKWKCKQCGVKVQKVNYLADNAAEVDHIVPVSLGGPHSYSNVQTLCRRCNQDKSNRYNGQLVLCV